MSNTKLLIPQEELEKLMRQGFVKPSLTGASEFLVTLVSQGGKRKEIIVGAGAAEPQKAVQTSNDKGHKDVEIWINEWRRKWKGKGDRPSPMGNKTLCIKKMREFFRLFPEYTKEEVFKARDKYFNKIGNEFTYLQRADNFISKTVPDGEGGTIIRRTLLDYC